ncbi:MAG: hypothetical protein HY910_03020 [Desulfarculus sp.]|nr:hypothetical protein [Desulfarculus sp.]
MSVSQSSAPRPRGAVWLLGLLLLLAAAPALASGVKATADPELIRQGREYYQAARYQEAQDTLRQALGQVGLTARQRAEALTWLGLTYLGQGHESFAVQTLAEARQTDPAYQPDPQALSPEALALWQRSGPGGAATPAPAPQGQYQQAPAQGYGQDQGQYQQAPVHQDQTQGQYAQPAPGYDQGQGQYQQAPAQGYGQDQGQYQQAPAPGYDQGQGQYQQAPAPGYGQDQGQYQEQAPVMQETQISEPPPPPPTAWLSQLTMAKGVKGGKPQGARSVFSPQDESIYLWFELHEVNEVLQLRALWTYIEGQPQEILEAGARAKPGDRWGLFSCSLRPGQVWPAGRYRVDVFIDQHLAGTAFFSVR